MLTAKAMKYNIFDAKFGAYQYQYKTTINKNPVRISFVSVLLYVHGSMLLYVHRNYKAY